MKKVIKFGSDSSYSNYGRNDLEVEVTSYFCKLDGWTVLVALNTVDDAEYVGGVEVDSREEAERVEAEVASIFETMTLLPELDELNALLAANGIELSL